MKKLKNVVVVLLILLVSFSCQHNEETIEVEALIENPLQQRGGLKTVDGLEVKPTKILIEYEVGTTEAEKVLFRNTEGLNISLISWESCIYDVNVETWFVNQITQINFTLNYKNDLEEEDECKTTTYEIVCTP